MQQGARSPQVWSAVLGSLVHLVSHCGSVVRGYLEGCPLAVVAALMHCCLEHRWCPTVYCQLARLAANMMYVAPSKADVQGQPQVTLPLSLLLLSLC